MNVVNRKRAPMIGLLIYFFLLGVVVIIEEKNIILSGERFLLFNLLPER